MSSGIIPMLVAFSKDSLTSFNMCMNTVDSNTPPPKHNTVPKTRKHFFKIIYLKKNLTNEFFEKSFTFSLKNLCEKERCEATGKLDKTKQHQNQGFSSCQVHDGGKYHKGQILFRLFKHLKKILKFTTFIIKESSNFIGLIPSQAHIYTISLCNNPNPTFKPF